MRTPLVTLNSHRHSFRVIYGDTDQMGVVYYANYLRYFEAGRNEWMRSLGIEYKALEAMGFILPVSEVSVKYHSPARFDDRLTIEICLAEVKRVSLRFTYRLMLADTEALIAVGETRHVLLQNGRVTRWPESLRGRLTQEIPVLS